VSAIVPFWKRLWSWRNVSPQEEVRITKRVTTEDYEPRLRYVNNARDERLTLRADLSLSKGLRRRQQMIQRDFLISALRLAESRRVGEGRPTAHRLRLLPDNEVPATTATSSYDKSETTRLWLPYRGFSFRMTTAILYAEL